MRPLKFIKSWYLSIYPYPSNCFNQLCLVWGVDWFYCCRFSTWYSPQHWLFSPMPVPVISWGWVKVPGWLPSIIAIIKYFHNSEEFCNRWWKLMRAALDDDEGRLKIVKQRKDWSKWFIWPLRSFLGDNHCYCGVYIELKISWDDVMRHYKLSGSKVLIQFSFLKVQYWQYNQRSLIPD